MDFSVIPLDPGTEAFWDEEVVPFFDEHLSDSIVERERAEGNGFLPALDRALAARGWTDTTSVGRAPALDQLRLAVVRAEEALRVGSLFPVRGSHNLVLSMLHACADPALRRDLFPRIAAGEVVCCLGYTEPDCGSDAAAIRTRAVADGDEWVVTGQKMFSTGAHLAQYVALTARSNTEVAPHKGITMFLVPLDAPGVEVKGIGTLGGERTNFVYLDQVRVPDTHRLGPVDQGWAVASGALAAEHGMGPEHGGLDLPRTAGEAIEALKVVTRGWMNELSRLYEIALSWAATALLADGRPALADPTVRARLAEIALDVEVTGTAPDPYARISTSDALVRGAEDLLDMAGSAGLLRRGEDGAAGDGWFEWGHRFAQGTSIYGGTTDIQRNLIAEQILGLPRHRGAFKDRTPR